MCFSLIWIEQLCIYIVIAVAIFSIIKLLLPLVAMPPLVAQIIAIVLWAVIAIFAIIVIFTLLSCLFSGSGLSLGPHR